MARRTGLGRGLSALIPGGGADEESSAPEAVRVSASAAPVTTVPIDRIVPNPFQPRTTIDPVALADLVESIRLHGIIQPLLVSTVPTKDGPPSYQLIAGERRLRAARAAELTEVPVTVRETTPREQLELAIIENVQRADLNPLEEAQAYQRLIDEFQLKHADVATRVGRSRAAISNALRLLDLPPELRSSLATGGITEGHARALLGIPDPGARLALWHRVLTEGLSVRQTERLVREAVAPPAEPPTPPAAPAPHAPAARVSADIARLETRLRDTLGTKVDLRHTAKGNGAVTIHFYSDEELEGILELLLGEQWR